MNAIFIKIPILEIENPQKEGYLKVYKDYWWASDGCGKAYFYKSSQHPQCNKDLEIIKTLANTNGIADIGPVEFIKIPWAYIKVNFEY